MLSASSRGLRNALWISSTITNNGANRMIRIHVSARSGSRFSRNCVGGAYMAPTWISNDAAVPMKSTEFVNGLLAKIDSHSLRQLPTCTALQSTIEVAVATCAYATVDPNDNSHAKTASVIPASSTPEITVRSSSSGERTPSFGSRGGRRSCDLCPGSNASATSWMPFVTTFSHRICAGSNGSGIPSSSVAMIATMNPTPDTTRKCVAIRMLANAVRPSATAA
ncbi:MAG: hypothetical protein EA379_07470 [Phycisphaerales bacterium]|nr:MAG: hypothetical protein EA379_07470 [Phycisphaerales bacterium]